MLKRLIPFFLALFFVLRLTAQEKAHPFIRNFLPAEYGGETQIWAFEQDNKGFMYLAGNSGIHVFNGNYWHTIKFKGSNVCRSLQKAKNGQIFVGLIDDFGYLAPDNKGLMNFVSLVHLVDSAQRGFADVWSTKCANGKVFFHTMDALFVYDLQSKKLKTIPQLVYYLNNVNGRIFGQTNDGLVEVRNDSLLLLSSDLSPWLILAMGQNRAFMLNAKTKQAEVINLGNLENISGQFFKADKAANIYRKLINEQAYHSIFWNDSLFLFGTLSSGILVMDKQGNFLETIGEKEGLENSAIIYLFEDNRHQVWAGTSNGAAYIEFYSPIRHWTKYDGLAGAFYGTTKLHGVLHVLTNLGLFYFDNNTFNPIPELSGENGHQVFFAADFEIPGSGKVSLAGTSQGIWEIKNNRAQKLITSTQYHLLQSEYQKKYFYFCDENYFVRFQYGQHSRADTLFEFSESIDFLAEFPENHFWFVSNGKITLLDNVSKNLTEYSVANQEFVSAFLLHQKLYFLAKKGVYTLENDSLMPDNALFGDYYVDSESELISLDTIKEHEFLIIDRKQNKYRLHKIISKEDNFLIDSFLFNRLPEVDGVFVDTMNRIYASGTKEVYQMALNREDFSMLCPVPWIEKMLLNGGDSLIHLAGEEVFYIDYAYNDVTFYFSLPFYDYHETNKFSYQLLGSKNEHWSDWQSDYKKEFSNLREGSYQFNLKAINTYNHVSEVRSIKFVVRPPYYRSNLAYFVYFLMLSLVVWLIIKLYTIKLKRENEQLENIVRLRTAEIMQQKEEIQAQAENLKELNDAVSIKNTELVMQKEEIQAQAENLQEINTLLTETNKEITAQKEEINKKNQDILSSIQYAKRIQKAVLKIDDDFKLTLPEHFILLKPKDIVSGDFYFIKQVGNILGIAAVDCTGHGVPGAFMSMLGTAFLTDIVHNKDITSASAILEQMRVLVKSSLSQTDKSATAKDGMDMGIIGINLETLEAQFAGAHQTLYIFRNNELLEWKGDRMPVGVSKKEGPFTNFTLKLHKNDVMYLFSDGYYDQFGGTDGRKLNKAGMLEILRNIQHKPMKEQHDILLQVHYKWIGDAHKQLDDILVMGFRF